MSTDFTALVYDLETGRRASESVSRFEYSTSRGFPYSLCYDARNNMIWGYDDQVDSFDTCCISPFRVPSNDASLLKADLVLRWRNTGVTPHFDPVRPAKDSKLIHSSSPVYRLEALRGE